MRLIDIISIYASGLVELVFAAFGFAIIGAMGLKLLGLAIGADTVNSDTLLFLWQSVIFMALWPGQMFWTIERTTSTGRRHSIIGVPTEDDLAWRNRQIARRIQSQARD